jgi:S-DNA-T family DNA segregation ATPase FtsK/SpoIIIE
VKRIEKFSEILVPLRRGIVHIVTHGKSTLWALGLFCSACWLLLILLSYNQNDHSLMAYQSEGQPLHNIGGFLGAHVASLLVYLFGGASVFALWILLYAAYWMLAQKTWRQEFDRVISLSVCVIACASLCARYHLTFFGSDYTGGLVGHLGYEFVMRMIGEPIATVVLLALFFCSLIILTRSISLYLLRAAMSCYHWLSMHKIVWTYAGKVLYWMIYPCVWLSKYVYKVFNGYYVKHSGRSIVDFERGLQTDEETRTIAEDKFWRTYLTEIATDNEYAKSGATKCDDAKAEDIVEQARQFTDVESASVQEKKYELPLSSLLTPSKHAHGEKQAMADLQAQARLLEEKLAHFGIAGTVVDIKRGPVVTLFEYQPDINARISKITALDDDLALALQAMSIRIIAPIPGKSVIGFEVSNKVRLTVPYADVIQSATFAHCTGALPLALGVDTVGNHMVVDLAKMPHVMIAGSTGSGKSVAMHTMIMSLLYKRTPDELKLILIDPKRLEFAAYRDIAHLVFPIVMQPREAIPVLKWVVEQMEERYEIMTSVGARNIIDYQALCKGCPENPPMPFLVVIIDELADLMMTCGRDIEDLIARIAQMARAAGIHMILATQRPSVDVITGLIKVNFPSRISCRVTSKVDSRTILDCNGAEKLLGRGDMLFLDSADSSIKRVHGAYVSDAEIAAVVNHIRAQREPNYLQLHDSVSLEQNINSSDDALLKDVVVFLHNIDEISISLLQRRFRIGFNRSARIMELLEVQGFIAPADGSKMRKVIRQ